MHEIPTKEEAKQLELTDILLPLNTEEELQESSLAYHLVSERGAKDIVKLWKACSTCESQVKFYTPPKEGDDYL